MCRSRGSCSDRSRSVLVVPQLADGGQIKTPHARSVRSAALLATLLTYAFGFKTWPTYLTGSHFSAAKLNRMLGELLGLCLSSVVIFSESLVFFDRAHTLLMRRRVSFDEDANNPFVIDD